MPTNNKKDFDPNALLITSQSHTEKISDLDNRVSNLEKKINDSNEFAELFSKAQKDSKKIDDSINSIIDNHDKHKITTILYELGKDLFIAGIGAIGTLLVQAIFK